jgi:hypothetical protein
MEDFMRVLMRWALTLLLLTCAVSLVIGAQHDFRDFNGTWKMNVTKSDFSRIGGLSAETLRIEHNEPKLRVRVVIVDQLGEHTDSYSLTTDGKKNSNSVGGVDAETTCAWSGKVLVLDVVRGLNTAYKERWSISEDGRTLTIKRHTILARSEITEEFVFDKQ